MFIKNFLLFIICLFTFQSFAQIKEFDKLEMFYDQGHYSIVYRKSNQLLDKPDYDFSLLPKYYNSISVIQLSKNIKWYRRHPKTIESAINNLTDILVSRESKNLIVGHLNEISKLQNDMNEVLKNIDTQKSNELIIKINQLKSLLEKYKLSEENNAVKNKVNKPISKNKKDIIAFAENYIGVPYLYAGDSPKGFDCSGFVYFVFDNAGVKLTRRAADQQEECMPISEKDVQIGDLVFFNNGGGVSHVGIVYAIENNNIQMIHASSSKGIIVTNLATSQYWKSRIHSFGRILD
jgi:cell wall-associated NlpC family hydrolase